MDTTSRHYALLSAELNKLALKDPEAATRKAGTVAETAREAGDEGFALFFQGEACSYLNNLDEAEELERRAAEMLPEAASVISNHGAVLYRMGREREALVRYDEALAVEPDNVHALTLKGLLLAKSGQFAEAVELYDKALVADPDDTYALKNKGAALCQAGEYAKALTCYEQSAEIEPWDYVDYSWLMDIYVGIDDLAEAESAAEKLKKELRSRKLASTAVELKLRRIRAVREERGE